MAQGAGHFYWMYFVQKGAVPQLQDSKREQFFRIAARLQVVIDQFLDYTPREISPIPGFPIKKKVG
jgi:hypothetical protein